MNVSKIISGLKFTIDMFLYDPNTGETITEPRNDMDKTTVDACRGAIELLEKWPKNGYISIDDAMAAFDDFMCNDIEPEGQEVFLEMLKDRAERSRANEKRKGHH